jgi:hypothetical protein
LFNELVKLSIKFINKALGHKSSSRGSCFNNAGRTLWGI